MRNRNLINEMVDSGPELLMPGKSILDWFDPKSTDHLAAYKVLQESGQWPRGFIPEGLEFPENWNASLAQRVARHFTGATDTKDTATVASESIEPAETDPEDVKIKKLTEQVSEEDFKKQALLGKKNEAENELEEDPGLDDRAEEYAVGLLKKTSKNYAEIQTILQHKYGLDARKSEEILNRALKSVGESKLTEQEKEPDLKEPTELDTSGEEEPPEPKEEEPEEVELEKAYLGRSADKHLYIIANKGDSGAVEDLLIVDQEGETVMSAKDEGLEVTDVPGFIEHAIQDTAKVKLEYVERGIVLKYILPKAEEELGIAEPEEEEEGDEFGAEEEMPPEVPEEEPKKPKEEQPKESKINKFKGLLEQIDKISPEDVSELELEDIKNASRNLGKEFYLLSEQPGYFRFDDKDIFKIEKVGDEYQIFAENEDIIDAALDLFQLEKQWSQEPTKDAPSTGLPHTGDRVTMTPEEFGQVQASQRSWQTAELYREEKKKHPDHTDKQIWKVVFDKMGYEPLDPDEFKESKTNEARMGVDYVRTMKSAVKTAVQALKDKDYDAASKALEDVADDAADAAKAAKKMKREVDSKAEKEKEEVKETGKERDIKSKFKVKFVFKLIVGYRLGEGEDASRKIKEIEDMVGRTSSGYGGWANSEDNELVFKFENIEQAKEAEDKVSGMRGIDTTNIERTKEEYIYRQKEGKIPSDTEPEDAQIKKLTEIKVSDDENTFDVHLVEEGTEATVISINDREFRFGSEFASHWRDKKTGKLAEAGLKELALDALSSLEEDEYKELVGNAEERCKECAKEGGESEMTPEKCEKCEAIEGQGLSTEAMTELKNLMFQKEKKEHPDFEEEQVWIIVRDHLVEMGVIEPGDELENTSKDDEESPLETPKDASATEEKPTEECEEAAEVDEKKKVPVCPKCKKAHWPFQKCSAKGPAVKAKSPSTELGKGTKESKEIKEGEFGKNLSKDWTFVAGWRKMINSLSPDEREKRICTKEKVDSDSAEKLVANLDDASVKAEMSRQNLKGTRSGDEEEHGDGEEDSSDALPHDPESYWPDVSANLDIEFEGDPNFLKTFDFERVLDGLEDFRDTDVFVDDEQAAKVEELGLDWGEYMEEEMPREALAKMLKRWLRNKRKGPKAAESIEPAETDPEDVKIKKLTEQIDFLLPKDCVQFALRGYFGDLIYRTVLPKEITIDDLEEILGEPNFKAQDPPAWVFTFEKDPNVKDESKVNEDEGEEWKGEVDPGEEWKGEVAKSEKALEDMQLVYITPKKGKIVVRTKNADVLKKFLDYVNLEKAYRSKTIEAKVNEQGEGELKDVYEVLYTTKDGAAKSTRIMAFNVDDAKKQLLRNASVKSVSSVNKIGEMIGDNKKVKAMVNEFILNNEIQLGIDTALDEGKTLDEINAILEDKKDLSLKKPKKGAALRSRGDCVFPANSPKVKDNADHFPINKESQARNAWARANQYDAAPKWYSGSLSSLVSAVKRAVKAKYPSIEVGKGTKESIKESEEVDPAVLKAQELLGVLPESKVVEQPIKEGDVVQIVRGDTFECLVEEAVVKVVDEKKGIEITGETIPENQKWFNTKEHIIIRLNEYLVTGEDIDTSMEIMFSDLTPEAQKRIVQYKPDKDEPLAYLPAGDVGTGGGAKYTWIKFRDLKPEVQKKAKELEIDESPNTTIGVVEEEFS